MISIKINDDTYTSGLGLKMYKAFLQGVFLTFQKGLLVSSMKLLLSAIETAAFLQTGNNQGREFKDWLSKYVDLSGVGVTPDELWEHRNALLHMTALDSRKVKAGSVNRLYPYKEPAIPLNNAFPSSKFYSVNKLLVAISKGFEKFANDINSDITLRQTVESNWKKIVIDEPSIFVKE